MQHQKETAMKFCNRKMFMPAFILFVSALAVPAQEQMSIQQAQSIVHERFPRVLSHQTRDMGNGIKEERDIQISDARVSGYKVEYDYSLTEQEHGFNYHPQPTSDSGTGTLDLKAMGPIFEVVNSGWTPPSRGGRRPGTFTYSASAPRYCSGFCLIDRDKQEYINSMFMWSSREDAALLAQALNRLAAFAQSPEGIQNQQEIEGKATIKSH
jgi:hypothetical protein